MTRARSWSLLSPLLFVIGCGAETVEVRVTLGDCDPSVFRVPSDPDEQEVTSADVVLKRDDNLQLIGNPACAVRGAAPLRDIDDFAALLSRSFEFHDVPVGGRWTIAVRGFSDRECSSTTAMFCGRATDLLLPPPDGDPITVSINCPPSGDLEDFKACVRE